MAQTIAIIGAGVAGMTAAIHARASGFEVDVYERHTIAGGLCTSWRIDGFSFDGCVEFFVGSGPASPFYALWREVGVVPRAFVDREIYTTTTFPNGQTVLLYADPDRLSAHFDTISPADRAVTAELCALVRLMRTAVYPVGIAPEVMTWRDNLAAMLAIAPTWRLWFQATRVTLRAFAARFQSPALRAALTNALPADLPLLALVQVLGDLANHAAGCPIGGSLPIAQAMARRCRALGVRLHFGAEVERIVVEGGHAVGLQLRDGEQVAADVVVAAGDLRFTLDRLLGGVYASPAHDVLFARPLVPAVCLVSFGLRGPPPPTADAVGHRHVLAEPVDIEGHHVEVLAWKSFAHDPGVAAAPRTVVTVTVDSPHERWNPIAADRVAYDAARARFGAGVRALMGRVIPGFDQLVETVDVATPVTVERYTRNHGGHYMTFLPDVGKPPSAPPRQIPGVAGLYLAGMWVQPPGGLPNALRSGREVVQVVCRDRGVPFTAAQPAPPHERPL